MSDEDQIAITIGRAARAKDLLENELLKECFTTLETSYTQAWRSTTIDDVSGREKLFLAINIVGKVKDHLQHVIDGGKMAQAHLNELNRIAERKKRFGIL
ncbi:MAG TPA: hypothetical protein VJ846_01475 [Sphingomicrobium sp.]|nr:hypothetical protein [Sphingomicrobium sp.]